MKLTTPRRIAIHAVLIAGSCIFIFPFIWLITTSLKPVEQIMKMPPDWLPRAYYAPVQGQRLKVVKEREIDEPSLLIRLGEGKDERRLLLAAAKYADGKAEIEVRVADRTELARVPATVEKEVPKGWWLVREKLERLPQDPGPPARWDCAAPAQIEEKIEPAWWNYKGAIRYTGYYEGEFLGWTYRVPMFLVYLRNTLIVALLGVIGTTLSSALAAYGFARIPWPGRDKVFLVALSTMMVPFAVTMVPLYGVFRALGWIGTLKPLWVPAFFGSAFNIFLLRQFFRTIPQDLSEAARIDGCSEFGIFWRIMLPLSKPALAVVALFHFMWAWNDFMGPLIFLTKQETYTLSLGLQFYQSQHGGSEWHFLMAASTLMILPIVVLFFFTQRTFIQGISTTGMKN